MPFVLLLVHAGLTGLASGAVLLLGLRQRRLVLARPSLPRAGVALLTAALTAIVHAFAMRRYGVDFFGIIHLWFIDVLVVAPLLGLALMVQLRRSRTGSRLLYPLAVALVACGAAGVEARWFGPYRLRFETAEVNAGDLPRPIRIGVLADLQTDAVTEHERRAVRHLLAAEPDLIVIPGDLFQGSEARFERALPELKALLGELHAPLGVYAVIGNSDTPARFRRLVADTDIVWLHNRLVEVPVDGGAIALAGVTWTMTRAVAGTVAQLEQGPSEGRLRLLLTHEPGLLYDLDDDALPPDLAIAGHTHGGQVRLPVLGAVLTLSKLPARYAAGLNRVRGTWLYVSRGVGLERGQAPPIRFLCPPEVTLLTVHPDR